MKNLRLTFLVSSLTIGGAEQLLLDLLRNIHRERFEILITMLREPGLLGQEVLRLGYRSQCRILQRRVDLLGIPRLARLFKREQTDLLFLINHRNTLFYGVPAAKLAGVPAIVNWENETFKRYSFNALTVLNHRLFHLGVDGVVAAARGHAEYVTAVERIPARKVRVIYNGVDPGRFQTHLSRAEAKRRLGLPERCPVVSIIGVLRPDKAHGIFLQAAGRVLRALPDCHFLVVGDGPERTALTAQVQQAGMAGQVHFLGFRRDLAEVLAAVEVNALSSWPRQETLSVAVIEAMAAGVPTVSTDVGFMREVVIPNETGMIVPVGDAEALAACLIGLLQDEALRGAMSKRAAQLVEERLSVTRMCREFEEFLLQTYVFKQRSSNHCRESRRSLSESSGERKRT